MILTNKHFLSLSHLSIYAPSWSGRELFEHPSYGGNVEGTVLPRNEHTESCAVLVRLPGHMVVMWSAVLPKNEHTESCTVLVRLPGHMVVMWRAPYCRGMKTQRAARCWSAYLDIWRQCGGHSAAEE